MRHIRIKILITLLAGVIILTCFRWHAWFVEPEDPEFTGDTLVCQFNCFGADTLPGFRFTDEGWQDLNQPGILRVLVLGDVHNTLEKDDYEIICKRHENIDAYAQLGDWMERGTFYYQQQLLHQLKGTCFEQLPVIPCVGNHEYKKGIRKHISDLWLDMFNNPKNGPYRFIGSSYYVDFPAVRFIVIDTQGLLLLSDYTITLTWLNEALDGAGDRFTIVMMHQSVYSSGKGRFNLGNWLTFCRTLQNADVVFAGHDHNYAVRDQFINTNSSTKTYANKNGQDDEALNSRLYELVEIVGDTLRVQTYSLDREEYIQTFQFAPFFQELPPVTK